jgi:hypothetical protein
MKELKNSEKKKEALKNHRFGDIYYISVDDHHIHWTTKLPNIINVTKLMILPRSQPSFHITGIEMLKDDKDCNSKINIMNASEKQIKSGIYRNLVKMINISYELRIGKLNIEQYNRIIEMFFSEDVVQRQMIIDILNNLE